MKYMYAALLLHSASQPVNEDNVKKVLTAAGMKPDENRVKILVDTLSGIRIDDVLSAARAIFTSAPAPAAAPAETKAEKKTEETPKGEALEGLGALFG